MRQNPLINHIQKINFMMKDPGETGFVTWTYKQQLLEAKWLLDECLENSPTYAGEEEWIAEQKTDQALRKIERS